MTCKTKRGFRANANDTSKLWERAQSKGWHLGRVEAQIRGNSEFVAKEIQRWLGKASVRTLYIQKASPWENAYVESFNGRLRDELLNGELFLSLAEVRYVLDGWRLDYNHRRPHSSLNWQTPAAFAASLTKQADEVFSSAPLADPPVGAPPLPPAQQAKQQPLS